MITLSIANIKEYLTIKKISFDDNIFDKLKKLKQQAINILDEELANEIWCIETICSIQKMYINMFYQLKSDKYDNYFEAWNTLEQIDIKLSFLRDNFNYSGNIYHLNFIEGIIKEYEKIFPYEYFLSRESIVKKERCSICNEINTIRNHCEHKIGKLYMGEMCGRIVEDFEFIGSAIVKNPFDKYSVLFPEDMEYNYFMLESLMPSLKTPYDRWYVDVLKEKNPSYRNVGRNELCPCNSGKKYKYCCLDSDGQYTNHHRVTLLDNPNVNPNPFTLGSTWKR